MAEGKATDLQFTPDGVNVAVKQEGALDVQPTISVSTTRDTSSREAVEIAEITGQFENVQIGDDSSVLFSRVSDEDEARPPTSVTTKENLHFIIDSPQGVVQIGKCCILLRVNFSNSLVSRLLDEGDVSVKLQSSDTLLELHWTNWEEKKEGIRSKIKVEIRTSLEQSRDSFEHDVFCQLLNSSDNYMQLRTLVNLLYDMFGAMLHRITGGCIELWIKHATMEQYEEMKKNKYDIESMLTQFLSKEPNNYTLCIRFQDDESDSQRPTLGSTTKHESETLESPDHSADDVSISKTQKTKQKHRELVSHEEMQTYVKRTIDESIKKAREGLWEKPMLQPMREPPPPRVTLVQKEDLRGIIWQELNLRLKLDIVEKVGLKGKNISLQVRDLIMSYYELIYDHVEGCLPDEQYMDLLIFRNNIYNSVTVLHEALLIELERVSALDKGHLSEADVNELNVRNKSAVELCGRAIAACSRQVVPIPEDVALPPPRQTTERLIKEPGETSTHVPEKEADTVRPIDAETIRLQKERLLQQATTSQKDFLKQELDFYEINEKPDSELPLGTRVEPKSKRALLQASLQRPGTEATARLEAAEETFGTVVSHSVEDEEQVIVHWDNPDESFLYHESGIRAIMRQVPRKIMQEQQVGIGVFVEKSANWAFEDQAGPVGVGTVIRHDIETGLVQVKWHGGVPGWNSYRTAEDVETRQECFIDGEEQSSDH